MVEVKKANFEYISKETEEFLGVPFVFDENNYGGLATAKQNTKVKLIYKPRWDDWLDAMYYTAFTTWNNGHEINLDKIPAEKRRELTLSFLKKRPISAVLESAIFVIKIDNIPRALTHQIVRHRGASFNQESYRVTPAHHADFRIPEGMNEKQLQTLRMTTDISREAYVKLISSGVPIEQARNVLGMGTCTHIVCTMNLKVLIDYIKARTLEITQDEHTYLVCLIARELKTMAPKFYENFIQSQALSNIMAQYGVKE